MPDFARGPSGVPHQPDDCARGEEWRPILGFEGLYEVSNWGRVRSLYWEPPRIRKTAVVKGYPHITLTRAKVMVNRYVHTLVCEAFHGPRPTPKHQIRHLNGDPFDNRAENLTWGTSSENNFDQVRHGTHSRASRTHCKWGHEYTPETTDTSKGHRLCLLCRKRRNQASYERDSLRRGRRRRSAA